MQIFKLGVREMNKIIVIAGPTGSGKTTVADYLNQRYGVVKVITHTTRPQRTNEKQGVDYYFETADSFDQNHYLEQVQYAHYRYGSSYEGLTQAWQKNPIACIVLDTAGAITYQQKLGDQVEILFLRVQKEATLKQRLLKRGDSMDSITKRINSPEYRRDMELPSELQGKATVIDNDDWQATKQKLDAFYLQVKKQILDV